MTPFIGVPVSPYGIVGSRLGCFEEDVLVRRVVVGALAAVVIAGGAATAVWRADAGSGPSAAAVAAAVTRTTVSPSAQEISCASPTSCLAVGSTADAVTGASVPAAQDLDAGTWRTVTVKPPVAPGVSSSLTGVSCPAASNCLAVGEYNTVSYGDPLPYAMTWDGTSLSPVAPLPFPPGAYLDALGDVNCPAVDDCVLLGLVTGDGSAGTFNGGELVWTWNGTTWSMTAVPTPDTVVEENLGPVQCTTVIHCVAAGQEITDYGNVRPAFDTWNGDSFTPHDPPVPAGMSFAAFTGLSCASRNLCAAIGSGYPPAESPVTSFLDVWNGRTWNITLWAGPTGGGPAQLSSVSCVSASDCIAVGSDGGVADRYATALAWNGSVWTTAALPGLASTRLSLFSHVTCWKDGGCTALGEAAAAGDKTINPADAVPITGQWNGSAWQVTTP
jgi:hypothetical protein